VGDCSVTISGAIEGERLHLAVSDNGKGCDEQDVMNDPGIGLSKIKNCLEQMFGDDFSINIQRVLPSGFQISLEMPYIYSTIKKRR
jgi:LytS/YehU family sensor histidine kinase